MQTVAIRELSVESITRATTDGQLVGVTNMGTLVGVLVPLASDVLERMANRDSAEIQASVGEAEAEMASGHAPSTLTELSHVPGRPDGRKADFARVTIRELSGARLERAAHDGETLLVSSGHVALALLIPVMPDWVERLVESDINRIIDGAPAEQQDFPVGKRSATTSLQERWAGPPSGEAERIPGKEGSPMGEVTARRNLGREFLRERAIGIRILADAPDHGRLLGVVTDMLARVVAGPIELTLENIDEGHGFAQILSLVDDLQDQISDDERLVGVGLEIGGHVHQGRVIYSANAHWDEFPLVDRLTDVLRGLPVVLENDANALAIYERRFKGIAADSLAVMLLTHFGVGCGLILDGQIYRGTNGMSGEVGHIPVGGLVDGREVYCRCGNHGCLERIATPSGIESSLKESGFVGGYETALRSADTEKVRRAFQFAGAGFGRGAATIINLLNPAAIVFYGPADLLGPSREFHIDNHPRTTGAAHLYAGSMVEAIRNHAFSTGASDCQFIVRNSVDVYGAQAAAACLINRVLPAARRSLTEVH